MVAVKPASNGSDVFTSAVCHTNQQMSSPNSTKPSKAPLSHVNNTLANCQACGRSFSHMAVKTGKKLAVRAPSPNKRLAKLGNRNAKAKASITPPPSNPNRAAVMMSRIIPNTLLSNVPALVIRMPANKLLCLFSAISQHTAAGSN